MDKLVERIAEILSLEDNCYWDDLPEEPGVTRMRHCKWRYRRIAKLIIPIIQTEIKKKDKIYEEERMKLTIEYLEKTWDSPSDFNGCWVARFRSEGLTAYAKTIKMATDKLLLMLEAKREMEKS